MRFWPSINLNLNNVAGQYIGRLPKYPCMGKPMQGKLVVGSERKINSKALKLARRRTTEALYPLLGGLWYPMRSLRIVFVGMGSELACVITPLEVYKAWLEWSSNSGIEVDYEIFGLSRIIYKLNFTCTTPLWDKAEYIYIYNFILPHLSPVLQEVYEYSSFSLKEVKVSSIWCLPMHTQHLWKEQSVMLWNQLPNVEWMSVLHTANLIWSLKSIICSPWMILYRASDNGYLEWFSILKRFAVAEVWRRSKPWLQKYLLQRLGNGLGYFYTNRSMKLIYMYVNVFQDKYQWFVVLSAPTE